MPYNEDMKQEEMTKKIAEKVAAAGGRTFCVGGFLRDRLLSIPNKDIDIEVHGITPETLKSILEECGELVSFGKSFGVYSLRDYDIDIAMPRKEKVTGKGHRDFEIDIDPFIGCREAARRRDFTVNALMQDVMSGEIIDSFGGLRDLENKTLRCVDPKTFIEDPLRVLRGAQFAARFHFTIEENTMDLFRQIDLSHLSKERVEEELKKALLKSDRPSVFFEVLRECGQLDVWFTELKQLIGLPQDPLWHPEGDVWTHTMQVTDRCVMHKDDASDPCGYMLTGICHDLGKIITTEVIDGRIHSYGHETRGIPLVRKFLSRFSDEKQLRRYVVNMTSLHMRPVTVAHDRSSIKATNHLFDEAFDPLGLIYFSLADKGNVPEEEERFLFDRYDIYQEYMSRPFVTGQDLIDAGLQPSESFSKILEYAHKLRLAGVKKDNALKQTLSYAEHMKE